MTPTQRLRTRFRPDLKYATRGEMEIFKEGRERGTITMFRASACDFCKTDIPKNKDFCSKECQENDEKRRKKPEKARKK